MTPQVYINNHLSILTKEETRAKVSQMFRDSISENAKAFFLDCLTILNK